MLEFNFFKWYALLGLCGRCYGKNRLRVEERLSRLFKVTLLHEKVNFHLCLTYKILVIGYWVCNNFVYIQTIAYARA